MSGQQTDPTLLLQLLQSMKEMLVKQEERLNTIEYSHNLSEINSPPSSNTTRIISDLSRRIPEFSFHPSSETSFTDWFSRYELIFTIDGEQLDDKSRLRLLTEKLDTETYRRFESHILPKLSKELTFDEAVTTLKSLFEVSTSIFTRQYLCWTSEFDKNSLEDDQSYGDRINERFHKVMDKIDLEGYKVLRFLVGLQGRDDQEHLLYLLSYADSLKNAKEKITLQGMVDKLKKHFQTRRTTRSEGF